MAYLLYLIFYEILMLTQAYETRVFIWMFMLVKTTQQYQVLLAEHVSDISWKGY